MFSTNGLDVFIVAVCSNLNIGQLYYVFSTQYIRIYLVNTFVQMGKEVAMRVLAVAFFP